MEIIVQGKGSKYVAPDEVIMTLNFITKGCSYEEVLNLGSKNVKLFIDKILIPNGFLDKDMKTRNFVIREETKFNNMTNNYDFDGYSFNQYAMLKFDYDIKKMAKIMEEISKLENPPKCQINFGIKDERSCKSDILTIAYKDAETQAKIIAKASGKTLKQCTKIDFKPFTTEYISPSTFDSNALHETRICATSTIVDTFTPEDVELTETLYCLWIAE